MSLLRRTGLPIDITPLEPLVLLPAPYVLELLLGGAPIEFAPDLPLDDELLLPGNFVSFLSCCAATAQVAATLVV
jgi:hypothetical protein